MARSGPRKIAGRDGMDLRAGLRRAGFAYWAKVPIPGTRPPQPPTLEKGGHSNPIAGGRSGSIVAARFARAFERPDQGPIGKKLLAWENSRRSARQGRKPPGLRFPVARKNIGSGMCRSRGLIRLFVSCRSQRLEKVGGAGAGGLARRLVARRKVAGAGKCTWGG